jgi:long-subunit fatty acid transport protein
MLKHFRKTTGLVVAATALAAAFGANAFTASNTVAASASGAGSAAITGYVVTNPAYTYSGDGTTVTAVSFNLDSAAADVKVALKASPVVADWQDCGASAGTTPWLVTCTLTTPVAVASATKLSVVAVSTGTATIA